MSWNPYTKRHRILRAALLQARLKSGLTQQELAKRLGKDQSFISKYERGERRIEAIDLLGIAEALDLDLRLLQAEIRESEFHKKTRLPRQVTNRQVPKTRLVTVKGREKRGPRPTK